MRELTDTDRLALAILSSHLEFQSSGALGRSGNALLEAAKRYLIDVGLEPLVVEAEAHEQDRVRGIVLTEIPHGPIGPETGEEG